jgi:hypothetical protein
MRTTILVRALFFAGLLGAAFAATAAPMGQYHNGYHQTAYHAPYHRHHHRRPPPPPPRHHHYHHYHH